MNLQIVLKFVGCICIFSSSLLIGNTMEKKLKQRYLFFREMTAALSCLEKEMIHYRLILPQALEKASSCCRANRKSFLRMRVLISQNMADRFRNSGRRPYASVFRQLFSVKKNSACFWKSQVRFAAAMRFYRKQGLMRTEHSLNSLKMTQRRSGRKRVRCTANSLRLPVCFSFCCFYKMGTVVNAKRMCF